MHKSFCNIKASLIATLTTVIVVLDTILLNVSVLTFLTLFLFCLIVINNDIFTISLLCKFPDPYIENIDAYLYEDYSIVKFKNKDVTYKSLFYLSKDGIEFTTTEIDEINVKRVKKVYSNM